jgi:hypothetical protein
MNHDVPVAFPCLSFIDIDVVLVVDAMTKPGVTSWLSSLVFRHPSRPRTDWKKTI